MQRKSAAIRPQHFSTALLLLLLATAASVHAGMTEYRFRVLLDDDEIGSHRFRVSREADREQVEINADFAVTFLGITVYSYDHDNVEQWRDGCLLRIDSSTDDNGDRYAVDGRDQGGSFELATQDGERRLDADCVMSFAYWNRDYLRQTRLLNSQNGEYLDVEVEAGGIERLRFDEREIDAERYRLRNRERDVDITVWYAVASGEWLCLESRVDGRVIRYLPEGVSKWQRPEQPALARDAAGSGNRR